MTFEEARKLKEGDRVVAIKDGMSRGVCYAIGELGTVAYKEGLSFFAVALDRGETTGIVDGNNWKILPLNKYKERRRRNESNRPNQGTHPKP